jgi:HEAT repeat protein
MSLRLLAESSHSLPEAKIQPLLQDPDLAVRTEAVRFLCAGKSSSRIVELLNSADPQISVATIEYLRKYNGKFAHLLDGRIVERFLETKGDQGIQTRIAAAAALGLMAPEAPQQKHLPSLLHDAEFEVARRAMLSAGESQRKEWVPLLLERLTDKSLRPYARRSLLKFGPPIIPVLVECLNNPRQPLVLRAKIPRVLGMLKVQASVHALLDCTLQPESFLGHRVIKALNKLRASDPILQFPPEKVEFLILQELGHYCLHGMLLEGEGMPEEIEAVRCLKRSLRERMNLQWERVFRLLGLVYSARDMHTAYQGIRSPKVRLRASAIELLDNLLTSRMKGALLSLLEEPGYQTYRSWGNPLLGINPEGPEAILKLLASGPDLWLQAAAIHVAGCLQWKNLLEEIRSAASSPSETIRQVAAHALWRLEPETRDIYQDRKRAMLTLVDKVLHLQAVDSFAQVPYEDLAYLARIAEEIEIPRGVVIYKEDDPANTMYVVVSGRVSLLKGEEEIMTVSEREAFGTWALFDDEPRVFTARVMEDAQLLKIHEEDFLDLLADHTEITQSLFKALVQRIKGLMPS